MQQGMVLLIINLAPFRGYTVTNQMAIQANAAKLSIIYKGLPQNNWHIIELRAHGNEMVFIATATMNWKLLLNWR